MKATVEINDSQFDKLIKQSIDTALGNINLEKLIENKVNSRVDEIIKKNLSCEKVDNFARDRVSRILTTESLKDYTFSLEAKEANEVSVIGDFNDWKIEEGSLGKLKNGTFKGTFELPKDNIYEFKYVVDGNYINEPEADSFKWNDFAGAENSVLVV